jgi:SAM-dependent methyltransferase
VLVPGNGDGRNGVWLAEQGHRVKTLDLSPVGVAKALALATDRGVSIEAEVADLAAWSWPEQAYDAVVTVFLHLSPTLRPPIHASIARALRPGGLLVIEGFSSGQMRFASGGPRRLEMLFTPDLLTADFSPLLIAVSLEEREAELSEGPRHRGRAALVSGVFRRENASQPRSDA